MDSLGKKELLSSFLLPSPTDPHDPGITPRAPTLLAGAFPSEPPGKPIHRKLIETKYL